jgi:hypothetical protein
MRGYQLLQHNRSLGHQDESFEQYLEKMALLGSLVTRIQEEQDGVVLFKAVEGNETLIDDKIAEELQLLPTNIAFLPQQER